MKQQELLRKIYRITAVLILVLGVFLGSVIFLNPSSVGNPGFVRYINLWAVVWAINFVILLVLTFILARSLIKLFFEYQRNQPGSRIKTKLVLTLTIFSLFPALVMAFLAFGLINENLRQWFSSPSEQLLQSSKVIASRYYQQDRLFRVAVATVLADRIGLRPGETVTGLQELARQYDFDGVVFFSAQNEIVARAGHWAGLPAPESAVQQVLAGEPYYVLKRLTRLPQESQEPFLSPEQREEILQLLRQRGLQYGESIVDYGVVGVPVGDASGRVDGALFANFVVPEGIAFHAIQVDEASEKYEAIKKGVTDLQLNYFFILGLTTLAVIAGFVWLGTYVARKITVPLEALAEGSRKLAEGNLDYRVDVATVDELATLVGSFNRMGEELKQSRQKIERANAELRATNERLDERRRYIETILQNVATGVISIDESDVIRAVNEAALKMLQVSRANILNQSIRKVVDPDLYQEFQIMKKRVRLQGTYRKEVTFKRGARQLQVAATVTRNPHPFQREVEYLIVLDDLTELIKAEKFAAWQEVARRLAHEIKNPLTPIQLSAERVEKRFEKIAATHADDPAVRGFKRILEDATRIIVHEAEILKALVEEFSKFARLPICRPTDVNLHELMEQTLTLYDGGPGRVEIRKIFDSEIDQVRLDPEQIQRVLINLIDNALASLAESADNPLIVIRTELNKASGSVTVEVQDNGVGIPPQDYEHLFLPYFSTKRKSSGLGLAIVRQIISEHSGFVRAEPNHPRGTRLIMELPLRGPQVERKSQQMETA